MTENQFVLLRSDTDPKKTMLGRFYGEKVTALRFGSVRPFGVKPRSVGQQFLQEALLLPAEEVPLAIIPGPGRHRQDLLRPGSRAGTGTGDGGKALSKDPGVPSQRTV